METELLPVLNLRLGCVVNNEIRLEVCLFLSGRTDEHVLYEVSLPSNLHDETNSHTSVLVGTAEAIDDIKLLVGKLLLSDLLHSGPCFLGSRMVIILILVRSPPYRVLGVLIHDDELILRRTTGVHTSEYIYSAELGLEALLIACKTFLGLLCEQLLV